MSIKDNFTLYIFIFWGKNNEIFKSELVNDGGKHKVPCLKIEKTNAKTEWLYESDEIILFLKKIIAS